MTRAWWRCVSLLTLCCAALLPAHAAALTAYGITTSGALLMFDTDVPDAVQTTNLTGLQPGEQLVAIDFRAVDRRLYGLSNQGRLYRIDTVNGEADWLGSMIGIALEGVEFAMDWDPVNDNFRVISNTGQNFRLSHLNGGQAIDSDENNPGIQPDTPFSPFLDVRAAAFVNNYAGADTTRLFLIAGQGNRLRFTDMPNAGTSTDVGALGVNITSDVAFDVPGPTAFAYMVIPQGLGSRLYTVNMVTGAATPGALIGQGLASERLRALAIVWAGDFLRGVTADNRLVRFHSMKPGTLISSTPITGLQPGETIRGLDFRASTPNYDEAFALGTTGRLYRITAAGQATQVGVGSFLVPLQGTRFGFNFDPSSDDIRVVSDTGQNLRLDPDTGLIVDSDPAVEGVQIDTPVAAIATPAALAYVPSGIGVLQNAFYGLDPVHHFIFRLGGVGGLPSPSTGQATPLTLNFGVDAETPVGFDWSLRDNVGYASTVVVGHNLLQRVSPGNSFLSLGEIGGNLPPVTALAVEPGSVWRVVPGFTDFHHPENALQGAFVVERTNTNEVGYIKLRVSDGTATRDSDYSTVEHIFSVPPGQSQIGWHYNVFDDPIDELGETVFFELQLIDPGSLPGGPTTGMMTIVDNDGPAVTPPVVKIVSPSPGPDKFARIDTSDKFVTLTGTATSAFPIVKVTWTLSDGMGFTDGTGTATGTNNWTIPNIPLIDGDNLVFVRATDINGEHGSDFVWFRRSLDRYSLAEGATGTFFDLDLAIANPNPVEAPVDITFLTPSGTTVQQARVLPPASRTTIEVDEIPGLEGSEVSTVVRQTSSPTLPLAVERTMRWDASGYGTHAEKAVHGSGARTWYFAEGSQGFFDTFFLLANPGDTANDAVVEMFTEDGVLAATQNYPLAPHSRLTVYAGDIPALRNRSFWTRVTFAELGIAERAMYFGAPLFNAGHESHGITLPSTTWFHAEGATGTFFTTFLLLANPNDQAAQVTLTYLPAGGAPVAVQKVLAPRTRTTINVALEHASLGNAAVATRIESSLPILSERSMYWPGAPPTWHEAHNSFGETATDTRWALAEGRIGGSQSHQTYILLANPGNQAATVTVAYLRESGEPVQKQYVVPALSRFNIDVGTMVPELSNEAFGAFIQSTHPIFVERSIYSNAGGIFWSAGTDATATRIPSVP
jgi:Domain of unknown function (DUF4394)/Calx-beta domain